MSITISENKFKVQSSKFKVSGPEPKTCGLIVSFNSSVRGDVNFCLEGKADLAGEQIEQIERIAGARGVVLPQSVKAHQYGAFRRHCGHLFPNYDYRFGFEGKYGNIQLFRKFGAPHPETLCYSSVADFRSRHFDAGEPLFPFPFVLKGDLGGGGWAIFLVRNREELGDRLAALADERYHITRRFIAQAFVPHGGRDLRVVVIGDVTKAYWRCQNKPGEFRNNVGRGAVVNHDLDPRLTAKGVACVRSICEKTGISLAAFDVLFDRSLAEPEPLLSEINFLFGRRGLGGSKRFHELLNQAVQRWKEAL